jgi:hypothetical protein
MPNEGSIIKGSELTIADGDAETNGDADDENDDEDEYDGDAVSGGFQFGVCICGWSASRGRISIARCIPAAPRGWSGGRISGR